MQAWCLIYPGSKIEVDKSSGSITGSPWLILAASYSTVLWNLRYANAVAKTKTSVVYPTQSVVSQHIGSLSYFFTSQNEPSINLSGDSPLAGGYIIGGVELQSNLHDLGYSMATQVLHGSLKRARIVSHNPRTYSPTSVCLRYIYRDL